MDSDKITTITGAIIGAANSAQTVISQMQPGSSLHTNDYVNLFVSVAIFVFGFFTNKTKKA